MDRSNPTWYQKQARKILRGLKAVKQTEIAQELNESKQVISYRMKNVYQGFFEDAVRLLDLAGYEIVEKEED